MKVKLSVSELRSLFAVMVLAAEAIKKNTIPSREGEGKPIMNHREAMFHMINASEALLPYIADYESQKRERKSGYEIIGEDEADLITNLPPKVKEILEKLSESGAKVEVMKVEVSKY